MKILSKTTSLLLGLLVLTATVQAAEPIPLRGWAGHDGL